MVIRREVARAYIQVLSEIGEALLLFAICNLNAVGVGHWDREYVVFGVEDIRSWKGQELPAPVILFPTV